MRPGCSATTPTAWGWSKIHARQPEMCNSRETRIDRRSRRRGARRDRAVAGGGPAVIAVANRTFSKAEEIVQLYRPVGNIIVIAPQIFPGINSTSSSTRPQPAWKMIFPSFRGVPCRGSLAYDMMYGKGLTLLSCAGGGGEGQAWPTASGMLVEQAAEAFLIWHGIRPHTETVFRQLRLSTPLN